jgi:hypothetical protein
MGRNIKSIFCKTCKRKLGKFAYYNKSIRCHSCAQKGKLNHNWDGGLPKCKECKKELTDHRNNYCLKCFNKGNRNPRYNIHEFGKDAPNWQGGKSLLIKGITSLKKYEIWRSNCFKRDKYTCQKCKKSPSGKLNVHHIITLSNLLLIHKIVNLKQAIKCKSLWFLKNGITLCTKCHAKIHGRLRRKKNKK